MTHTKPGARRRHSWRARRHPPPRSPPRPPSSSCSGLCASYLFWMYLLIWCLLFPLQAPGLRQHAASFPVRILKRVEDPADSSEGLAKHIRRAREELALPLEGELTSRRSLVYLLFMLLLCCCFLTSRPFIGETLDGDTGPGSCHPGQQAAAAGGCRRYGSGAQRFAIHTCRWQDGSEQSDATMCVYTSTVYNNICI